MTQYSSCSRIEKVRYLSGSSQEKVSLLYVSIRFMTASVYRLTLIRGH